MFNNLSSLNPARFYPSRMVEVLLKGNEFFTMMNIEAVKALEGANMLPPGAKSYLAELARFRNRSEMLHLLWKLFADIVQMSDEDKMPKEQEASVLDKRLEQFRVDAHLVYDRFGETTEAEKNEWVRKMEDWSEDFGSQWAETMASGNDQHKELTKTFNEFWKDFFNTSAKETESDYSLVDARLNEFFAKTSGIARNQSQETSNTNS